MAFETEFVDLPLEKLHREVAVRKADGWRFIQTHAVNTDDGVDLYYSFMKDGYTMNLRVAGVTKENIVPSITDLFLAAFVFENEARELFGVNMQGIAIDFAGAMYAPAESEPMTFMSPEQKAAREKAAKAAAAKAAKEAAGDAGAAGGAAGGAGEGAAAGDAGAPGGAAPGGGTCRRIFIMTPERQARLDAKMATMSEEKKAKVRAALAAREAEARAAGMIPGPDGQMQPASGSDVAAGSQPAAESQAAAEAKAADVSQSTGETQTTAAPQAKSEAAPESGVDALLETKLKSMDPDKAAKVVAALAARGIATASAGADAGAGAAADAAQATNDGAPTPTSDEGTADAEAGTSGARVLDEQLEQKLAAMDPDKAAKVRAALEKRYSSTDMGAN